MSVKTRFVAKPVDTAWRVYDTRLGSFPYERPELGGKIRQDVPKPQAEAEAERLNNMEHLG